MKLKVTVWGINYSPEVVGIGPYNAALCDYLQAKGHSVRMLTSCPYYPEWKKNAVEGRKLFRQEDKSGVEVHRCWHYVPRRPTTLKRILHEASFALTSFLRLLCLSRPDVLVVVSPPLLLGAGARLFSWLRKLPYVIHVQDLQPDAAVGMGMIKPGLFIQLMYQLEAFAYRKATRVSGISHGMVDAFKRKGVSPEKALYFPNGVHLRDTLPPRGAFRKRLEIAPGDFLAVYSGNLGVKQGLEVLIDAARLFRNPRIRLIICGDGARRDFLARQIVAHQLSNVVLLPLLERKEYEEMLADADLCLITQQKGSGASFLPSKLLSCLAHSKPVLTVADETSELALALRNGGFGRNVEPGNPAELARVIEKLAANTAKLLRFAEAGFRFVQQFEFEQVLNRFNQQLISLATPTAELSVEVEDSPAEKQATEPVGV
jgi:colanic acid biosynthesis glycosyl transferase WcaI